MAALRTNIAREYADVLSTSSLSQIADWLDRASVGVEDDTDEQRRADAYKLAATARMIRDLYAHHS